jgi:creatinine amidohydrolase
MIASKEKLLMPGRPYVLSETNWKTVKETPYEVTILPWGATEAHNYHLPYATDVIQLDYIAAEAAGVAWGKGAKVVALPTIPFGVQTGQLDVRLDINLNPSTQQAILNDVADSLVRQGIPKLVILNGHGGNNFRQMVRELLPKHDLFVCCVDWYTILKTEAYFEGGGDHANEMETSLIQYIVPDWALPLSEAGDGATRPFKIKALREGWAWTQRDWLKATYDTGIGDPAKATPEKGKRFLDDLTVKIGEFLVELAAADVDDLYEEG